MVVIAIFGILLSPLSVICVLYLQRKVFILQHDYARIAMLIEVF